MEENHEVKLRVRINANDVHYAGNLVDGAHIMKLFGDVATEITIRYDGDEGLLRGYENVEFGKLWMDYLTEEEQLRIKLERKDLEKEKAQRMK